MPSPALIEPHITPFTIVVDTNEGAPWTFRDLYTPSSQPIICKIVQAPMYLMGRAEWGTGLADYSIEGHEEHIQIERKSVDDLLSTLLERRESFRREIMRLNEQCDFAAVIVEGTRAACLGHTGFPRFAGSAVNMIRRWSQRYPRVHWIFSRGRFEAMQTCYQILEFWWEDYHEKKLPRQSGTLRECHNQKPTGTSSKRMSSPGST